MQRRYGQFGWLRLVIVLAALGQLPAAASADSLFSELYGTPLKFVWATPLVPIDAVPGYAVTGPPVVSTEEFSNELFVSALPEPGLQFSLDPVEEEIFIGLRVRF